MRRVPVVDGIYLPMSRAPSNSDAMSPSRASRIPGLADDSVGERRRASHRPPVASGQSPPAPGPQFPSQSLPLGNYPPLLPLA